MVNLHKCVVTEINGMWDIACPDCDFEYDYIGYSYVLAMVKAHAAGRQ